MTHTYTYTHILSPLTRSVVQFFGLRRRTRRPRCLPKLNEFSWPNIIITCSFASRNGVIVSFLKRFRHFYATHTHTYTHTQRENDWVSVHYSDVRLRVTISVEFHVWLQKCCIIINFHSLHLRSALSPPTQMVCSTCD